MRYRFLPVLALFFGYHSFSGPTGGELRIFNDPSGYTDIFYCDDPVRVAPKTIIERSKPFLPSEGVKISISNYHVGEDLLTFTLSASPLVWAWNGQYGYGTLTGAGTAKDYMEALSAVYYLNKSGNPVRDTRFVSVSPLDADYLPHTGHFYKFISSPGITWSAARDEAASMQYYGLQGYLTTILDQVENDFITSKLVGVGWIGASDLEVADVWKWVTGPESGTVFWEKGNPNVGYSNWSSGEPNNSASGEWCGHMMYTPENRGKWNDLNNNGNSNPSTNYYPWGFIVEFGGLESTPPDLSASIRINLVEPPVLRFQPADTLVCGKLSHQMGFSLSAGTFHMEALSPGVVVTASNSLSPVITVPKFGTYHFRISMTNGCTFDSLIRISFRHQPTMQLNVDETTCYGYSLRVKYQGEVENDAFFEWYSADTLYSSGINLYSDTIPLGMGNGINRSVMLKVNEQGCRSTSPVVPVKVIPDLGFSLDPKSGCSPLKVNFNGGNKPSIKKWSWDFGDGAQAGEAHPAHIYSNQSAGIKVFSVGLAIEDQNGCKNSDLLKDIVQVFPEPVAVFTFSPEEPFITNPRVRLVSHSKDADRYAWNFGDGSPIVYNQETADHFFTSLGLFNIALEASNRWGCADTAVSQVTVRFDKLFPPNAFSPNSQEEENRVFRIYADGILQEGYKLTIFDRWGKLLFVSHSPENGWDGKAAGDNFVPPGLYTWILHYTDFNDQKHTQKGTVTLVF